MKKVVTAFLLTALFFPAILRSQEVNPKVRLKFDTRFDYTLKVPDTKDISSHSSFVGTEILIVFKPFIP